MLCQAQFNWDQNLCATCKTAKKEQSTRGETARGAIYKIPTSTTNDLDFEKIPESSELAVTFFLQTPFA